MDSGTVLNWGMDWAWGIPFIVVTIVFHAFGLGLINKKITSKLDASRWFRHPSASSVLVMGGTALWATLLHGFESCLWAGAYRFLGALPDNRVAVLYSLSAMTSYGHENVQLAGKWQLMSSLEALSGWILFGLTAAFLFTTMQKAWPRD